MRFFQDSGIPVVRFTVFDQGLKPKHGYTYRAKFIDGLGTAISAPLSVTTMDTTSQSFRWQIDTLGDGNSSGLYDVAVVNDTLTYAVGEIYLRDSTGQFDTESYGLAVWNGQNWQLAKVPYHDYGTTQAFPGPLKTICAFSVTDIFVSSSANLLHWDGGGWEEKAFMMTGIPFNGQVLKMWGTSGSDLYLVGRGGAIYHYDGRTWQKLESGTNTDIQDIWGRVDSRSGKTCILCAVSSRYSIGDKRILSIDSSGNISPYPWTPPHRINSMWFANLKKIFVCGGGLYVGTNNMWNEVLDLPPYFSTCIRGTGVNDVFVVGSFGLCGHFNGVTWRNYPEAALPNGEYEGLSVSPHMVIAVGFSGGQAVVLRGYPCCLIIKGNRRGEQYRD